jgi:uncharacterized protein YigE (DUF2233 family)
MSMSKTTPIFLLVISMLFGGCDSKRVNKTLPATESTAAPTIREITHAGHHFGVVDVSLGKSTLRLFWKKSDGTRIGTFAGLNDLVATSGDRVVFATNAGIFDPAFSPCGLYVEDGRELVPLNLKTGDGNFYLKPNGVFLIDSRGAAVVESSEYPSLANKPLLATQSGPLLLSPGQINSHFSSDSVNRRIRSGIGVISADHIAFAISRDRVTFYEFAQFFQSALRCDDALYLDGEISKFYPDPAHPSDRPDNFAGMFAVTVRG